LESSANARVHAERPGLQHESADQPRVDLPRRVDLAAGRLLDLLQNLARLVVGELVRRRQLDLEPTLLGRDERSELPVDGREFGRAALFDDHEQEVAHELVGIAEQLAERGLLRAVVDLWVLEQSAELRHGTRGLDEVAELLGDLAETVLLLRRVKEGAGVDAVRDGYDVTSTAPARAR
jgi:hypothetical protein